MKCGACGAETREQLCGVCLGKLAEMIADLPALAEELESTATRQTRGGSLTRGGNGDRPLPFATPPIVEAARRDLGAVIEWAAHITDERAVGSTLTGRVLWAVGWLLSELEWFRIDEDAPQAFEAVKVTTANILRAIDRPPARVHAGPCGALVEVLNVREVEIRDGQDPAPSKMLVPVIDLEPCEAPLVGKLGDAVFACRKCGATHTAADRKAFQLAALNEAELPLGEILAVLPKLHGLEVDRATVRKWRQRKRLIPARTTTAGVPLYRGGDVVQLADREIFRRDTPDG